MSKQRDYSNLKETERIWDAVKMNGTNIKDYSLTHLCAVQWRTNDSDIRDRNVRIWIGDKVWIGNAPMLTNAINDIVDQADADGWLPHVHVGMPGEQNRLIIDTNVANDECRKDHVAHVEVAKNVAIIDLEELLKATRYA